MRQDRTWIASIYVAALPTQHMSDATKIVLAVASIAALLVLGIIAQHALV